MSHYEHRKCPTPGCPGDPNFAPPWGYHGRDCHRTRIPARLVDWLVVGLVFAATLVTLALGALAIVVEGNTP